MWAPAGAVPDFRPESLVVVATVFRRRGPVVGCSPPAGQMRRARGVGAREEFVSEVLRGASTSRGTRAVSSVRRPPRSGPAVSPVSAARAPASSRWEVTRSALFPRDAPAPRADPRRPTTPRDRTLTPIPTIIPITSQRLESGRDTSDARPSGGATGALRAPRCRPRMTRRGVTAEGTKTVRRKWDPRARPNARRPLPPYLARRPRPVSRDGGRPRGPRPIPLLPRAHASFLFHTTSRMRLLWSRGAPPRASAPVAPPSPPPRKKPGTAPRIVAARARARARP